MRAGRAAAILLGLSLGGALPAIPSPAKTDVVTLDKGDRLNIQDSYDSWPATADATKNDLSVTSSLGYTF
jgi:hypothetical protein